MYGLVGLQNYVICIWKAQKVGIFKNSMSFCCSTLSTPSSSSFPSPAPHQVLERPTLLREFVNYGLGIQDFPIINIYLSHKDADYNAAFQIFKTTERMWSFFGRYFIISSLGLRQK